MMIIDMTANVMMMTMTMFDSPEACTAANTDEQEVLDSEIDNDHDDDDDFLYADGTRRGGLWNMQQPKLRLRWWR